MNLRSKHLILVAGMLAGVFAPIAGAATPDRDWPSVEVAPILDVPMRDTAITRAPDPVGGGAGGIYYLTGTLGPDFENNHLVKLWRSPDLKTWSEVGVVWDIDRHKNAGEWNWQSYWRTPMEATYRPPVRGVVAPELHYIKQNWYICFSMNGQGTGLIKSTTGKPEGPYEEVGQITTKGGDPSMFEDDDPAGGGAGGSVYWLFDGGWIAKLTDDLTALAERPRLLMPAADPSAPEKAKDWPKHKWADDPVQVGKRGAFLFKKDGRYFLTAADYNSRLGRPCNDTWIAYADNIYGPYSVRHLMVPHGGGITVFPGPRSSAVPDDYYPQQAFFLNSVSKNAKPLAEIEKGKAGDTLYAAFSGGDERALCRDRASFLPLEWTGPWRYELYFFGDVESFPRKPRCVFTEAGPWSRLQPIPFHEEMRDISILNAPDGYYYLTCSGIGRPGELVVYRSKDLEKWEDFQTVLKYEDIEWLPKKVPVIEGDSKEAKRSQFARTIWDVGMNYLDGTFWIWYHIFPEDTLGGPAHQGAGVLRSKTGKAEGPYESLGRKGGHYANDAGGSAPRVFVGRDGKLFANAVISWKPLVAEADPNDRGDWRKDWKWKPVDLGKGVAFGSDGWGTVHYIAGEYVFLAVRWGGPVFNPHVEHGGKQYGTYDLSYATGPTPWGPFGRPKPTPRNGGIFQDKEGAWWMMFFGNDGSGPWWQRPGLVPLTITSAPGDVTIDVKMPPYTDRELRVMGGGGAAAVQTVVETLKGSE